MKRKFSQRNRNLCHNFNVKLVFNMYGVSDIIFNYLHINDILKFVETFPDLQMSQFKYNKDIWICDQSYGERLVRTFPKSNLKLRVRPLLNHVQNIDAIANNITELHIYGGCGIHNSDIKKCVNLSSLTLNDIHVADEDIISLQNLSSLKIENGNGGITDR